jgi:hypothetical protein
MYKIVIITGLLLLGFTWSLAQNNVGIGVANPQAKLEVRGNGIGYDVFRASNDKVLPLDSGMNLTDLGHLGLGTLNIGNYRLVSQGFPSAFSPQIEVWQGNPNLAGSMLLGDINDVGGGNGSLNLYINGLTRNVQLRAAGTSYLTGGFLGLGLVNPQEQLHLTGAVILGQHVQLPPTEVPGSIEWNGTNFRGYNGSVWLNLDAQNLPDNDWLIQVGGWVPASNPELVPQNPPSSISMGLPGDPNQGAIIWIPDRGIPGIFTHQLMLESTTNALISDASMVFRMSNWLPYPNNPPLILDDYSLGVFRGDMTFKLFHGPTLGLTTQGDNNSMFRANASGIIDLPNQSRVRAIVPNIDWGSWQLIQPNTWTPVNYTNPIPGTPLAPGIPMWDEQGEFTAAASPNQATPPVNAFFTATEEGFYQVNARCEFEPDEYWFQGVIWPVYMRPNAYVSIAIYIDFAGGGTNWISYSIGNNLQVTNNVTLASPPPEFQDATGTMSNNNAPNVSDVLYLNPGDRVSIWVFHWAYTPMMIRVGENILYFSIHKVS